MRASLLNIRSKIKRTTIFQINPNRPKRANNIIVDYFSELDQISTSKFIKLSTNPQTSYKDLGKHILNYRFLLCILCLSTITVILNFIQDILIHSIQTLHLLTITSPSLPLNLFSWMVFSTTLCLISCYLSSFVAKTAEESEIAEVKAVISGLKIPNFFEYKTLILKFFTVTLLVGAGISMSKEGAFVHIAVIISYKLMKTKFFQFIYKNPTRRNQLLSISISAGLAAVFDSLFGAVMFSIEISTSYYVVSNMWRAALCTLTCSILSQLLELSNLRLKVKSTSFPVLGDSLDLFLFGILGALSGVLAYLFILLSKFLVFHRLHRTIPYVHSRYRYMIIVSILTSFITFWTFYLEVPNIQVMNDMFSKKLKNESWGRHLISLNLLFYLVSKLIVTALATSLEAPVGIIFPLFASGAVFGRIFGIFADSIRGTQIAEIYAAVGAACLVSASTHSVSVPIIIFCMTGEIHYLVPMMVAVFFAYSISAHLTNSFYDCMLSVKRISYMPLLQSKDLYDLTALNIVQNRFPCITTESTLGDLINALFMCTKYIIKIPIIKRDGILLYETKIKSVKRYLRKSYDDVKVGLGQTSTEHLEGLMNDIELIGDENFYFEGISRQYSISMSDIVEVRKFMDQKVDVHSVELKIDDSPFSIEQTTIFAKIQFMFLMLNLSQVYVTEQGVLVGIIARDSFIKTALRRNYSVY